MSVVVVEGLGKTFGTVRAVRDVSFRVERGEVFGILGPNGAGKSTTIEMISGAFPPDTGRVEVLGADPHRRHPWVSRRVGYQLQSSALPPALRVGEALDLFAAFYETPMDPALLLDLVGLRELRRRPFGKLSGGEKQRLSIALALIGDPEVVVFDELTTGLDPIARRDVRNLVAEVRDRGVTVILVTHFLEEAELLCDRLAVIDRGATVFVGTREELGALTSTDAEARHGLEDAYLRLLSIQPAEEV